VNLELVPAGSNPPESVNVVIEVPIGGEPVKYELDKTSGAIFVDRILHTAMRYPANYGFIPHTLGEDGDPLDCLVMARWPFMPGCVVRARPIAVLFLEDEAGGDEKLLAVPEVKTSPYYTDISEGEHLPSIVLDQIAHFFTHYKDLEPEKWTRVGRWGGRDEALKVITDGLARAKDVTFQASDATIGEGRAVEA
jgi:inorganic pyrophosphatase